MITYREVEKYAPDTPRDVLQRMRDRLRSLRWGDGRAMPILYPNDSFGGEPVLFIDREADRKKEQEAADEDRERLDLYLQEQRRKAAQWTPLGYPVHIRPELSEVEEAIERAWDVNR